MEEIVERRLHERIASGVPVYYEPADLARMERQHLQGLATSTSLGGMYVATTAPPRPGTVIDVRLYLDDADDAPPLHVKAIVRWRHRFLQPRGMGIEFLELERRSAERLAAWLPANGGSPETAGMPPFALTSGAGGASDGARYAGA